MGRPEPVRYAAAVPSARLLVAALGLTAVAVCVHCGGATDPEVALGAGNGQAAAGAGQRADLYRRFALSERRFLVVHGADDGGLADLYRARIRESSWSRTFTLSLESPSTATAEALRAAPVALVGTPTSNPWLRRLVPRLPVRFEAGGFRFLGRTYNDRDDVLVLVHPHPENPRQLLLVVTGNRDEAVLERAFHYPQPNDFEVWRRGLRVRFGRFDDRWAPDPERDRDVLAEIRLLRETDRHRFFAREETIGEERLEALSTRLARTHRRVQAFLGGRGAPLPRVDVYLWGRSSEKAELTGRAEASHVDEGHDQLYLALEGLQHGSWDRQTVVLLRHALGRPARTALEVGLGIALAEDRQARGADYWAARLHAAGCALPLAELLDNERLVWDPGWRRAGGGSEMPLRESPLVFEPLAASLATLLTERWGRDELLRRYRTWDPGREEIDRLEPAWRSHLDKLAARHAAQISRDRATFPRGEGVWLGANHTHETLISIDGGYLSEDSDAMLARLRALGANAVAVVPYTYLLRPDQPAPLPFLREAEKENDASVIHAALEARRLGMKILLKPHIQGVWPGAIAMRTEADWERFFHHYERWIRHYALLAEMHRIEALAVGVELVEATRGHEEVWRRLIARLRRIYSGQMVYAANWGEEFERLGFWDALDWIGIDSYYSLSDSAEASDAELLRGARAALERIRAVQERHGRPLVFTELGYVSTAAPWQEPWQDHRDRPLRLEHQARALRATLQALGEPGWWHGVLLWKWPSGSSYGGPGDGSHIFAGKPAEQVAGEWFRSIGEGARAGAAPGRDVR